MVIKDKLSQPERSILDEALRLLGDNLSAFLLAGLGETQVTHRRTFAARSVQGEEATCRLEMTNDFEQGLPIERDPLVMAHVLNVLHEQMRIDDIVDFSADNILKALGWPQTSESQLMIKQAIERYASTIYCLTEPAASEGEPRSHFQRLLISYETVLKPLSEESAGHLSIKVKFFPAFIYHIHSQRKVFLGIDFRDLQELKEISG
ncbi:MAG TPA: hypothetical protein VGC66_09600 [Pyrinomonadaceae bacterium]|jgi:hypothetical protein